jgi:ABC-type uncharacterized transport system involved in gliding motility auxiliary subunit
MSVTCSGAANVNRYAYFRSGLLLLAGIALLAAALTLQLILLETLLCTRILATTGGLLTVWGVFALRTELVALTRQRRGELILFTLGLVGVYLALGYFSVRYAWRFDLTEAGLHSLSAQTIAMLERLDKPVHIVFFHDPLMRETVERYQLMAAHSSQVTVEFHDPTLNPAQARLMGVQFAGTAMMQSEDRRLQVHGSSETDIANGILRVSQAAKQWVCFLEGHGEADPFSMESHDHLEGTADHRHGLGGEYVLHERHGLAKARHSLEALNFIVEKRTLVQRHLDLSTCALLIVAGPKIALLPAEIEAIRVYLSAGGNGFFMLEPFVSTGLEPIIREYGVVLDPTIVIDHASHYWADISAPAVTTYNRHQITRDLPLTFYPGVRSLSPTPQRVPGASVAPIVSASQTSYGETTHNRAEYDPGEDLPGPSTLMVVVNRRPVHTSSLKSADANRQTAEPAAARSRIAVVGDADFATNSFFHVLGNGNLFLNTVTYLVAQENLIGIEPRTHDLPRLSMTNRQVKGTFVLSVVLMPAVLTLVGITVWWRQR